MWIKGPEGIHCAGKDTAGHQGACKCILFLTGGHTSARPVCSDSLFLSKTEAGWAAREREPCLVLQTWCPWSGVPVRLYPAAKCGIPGPSLVFNQMAGLAVSFACL